VGNWLDDMVNDLSDIAIQNMEEYVNGLPKIYDGLSDEKLEKAYSLLKILEKKWYNDESFSEKTYEVIQLKKLVKKPFKNTEWRGGNSEYPTMPAEDVEYVEQLLNKRK